MHSSDAQRLLARGLVAVAFVTSLVLSFGALVVGAPDAGAKTRYERERELGRDVAELSARELEVHGALQLAEAEAHRLDAAARKRDRLIKERDAWLAEASTERDRRAAHEAVQARRLKAARGEFDRVRRSLVEQAVAAYASGATSTNAVRLVISVGDSPEIATAMAVADVLAHADRDGVDQARIAAAHMRRLHGAARAGREEADALVDRLTANRAKLVQDRSRVGQMRASAHATASSGRAVLEDIRKKLWASQAEVAWLGGQGRGSLEAELGDVQGKQAERPPKRGTLHTPVHGAVFSSGYGMRAHPISGVVRMHTGVDFAAPTGTPILAAADGAIFSADERPAYGLTVVIDHGGRLATVSAHMSAMTVAAGDSVRAGQLIGYVGMTGASTGPHLHFEVRRGGRPVDPAPWF